MLESIKMATCFGSSNSLHDNIELDGMKTTSLVLVKSER